MNQPTEQEIKEAMEWVDGRRLCDQNWLRDSPENDPGNFLVEKNIRRYRTLHTALEQMNRTVSRDDIFIRHIKNHLKPGQEVSCKICGKPAWEIIIDEGK